MKTLPLTLVLAAFCLSSLTGCLIIAKGDCKCCNNKAKETAPANAPATAQAETQAGNK